MPPTPVEMTLTPTLSVDSLVSAFAIASIEPCTSALSTILTSLTSPALILSRMFSSDTRPRARQLLLAARVVPVLDQRLGRLLVGDDVEDLARVGHAVQAQHLDRRRRAGLGDRLSLVVQHGADLPDVLAGDDQVADAQRAFLDQDGRDRAARAVEPRLDDVPLGRPCSGWPCSSSSSACRPASPAACRCPPWSWPTRSRRWSCRPTLPAPGRARTACCGSGPGWRPACRSC